MKKFMITWDSGDNDGETMVTAADASTAERQFSKKYPDREVISVRPVL